MDLEAILKQWAM